MEKSQECFLVRNTHRTQCMEASTQAFSVRCIVRVWPEQPERTGRSAPDAEGLPFERPVLVGVSMLDFEAF